MNIKKEDFQNLQQKVVIKNMTSRTDIMDASIIKIEGLLDTGLILQMPLKSCANGHAFMIAIFEDEQNVDLKKGFTQTGDLPGASLIATGKVLDTKKSSDNESQYVVIEFQQYSLKAWEALRYIYRNRQETISALIQKVRE